MVVIDTSILVAVQRGHGAATIALDRYRKSGEPIRVPAAVWIEFLGGLRPEMIPKARRILVGSVHFENLDRALADRAAQLQALLIRSGNQMPWHDLQIAATALHLGETLMTSDKAFTRIDGLGVEIVDA